MSFLKKFLYTILILFCCVSTFFFSLHQTSEKKIHLLFTDPFEDSDDLFAILSFMNQMLHSTESFRIITANEIVDKNGLGMRAMALFQLINTLAFHIDSPLAPQIKSQLQQALTTGRFQIAQGNTSPAFQRDYEHYRVSKQGDIHFYSPSLVEQFYQNPMRPTQFKSLHDIKNELLTTKKNNKIILISIAAATDTAVLFDDSTLFTDDFKAIGTPQEQIAQAKAYYDAKRNELIRRYQNNTQAQNLLSRVDSFWQMSGGFNHREEYNEQQSRIANDYLNFLFSDKNHGISPINTTRLLHPVGEFLKESASSAYWPVEKQIVNTPYIFDAFRENLIGRKTNNPSGDFPGFFDKETDASWDNPIVHSLNHDTLALSEFKKSAKTALVCHVSYVFNPALNAVQRSYLCREKQQKINKEEFIISTSVITHQLVLKQMSEKEAELALNQLVDAEVMNTFYDLKGIKPR